MRPTGRIERVQQPIRPAAQGELLKPGDHHFLQQVPDSEEEGGGKAD